MQCTAMFSNEPTELIRGYNSVFGAYNLLQDWVTTHVVKANLFRSIMNLWILVLKLKCLPGHILRVLVEVSLHKVG